MGDYLPLKNTLSLVFSIPFSEFAVLAPSGGKKFAFTFRGCEFDMVVRRLVKHIQGLQTGAAV